MDELKSAFERALEKAEKLGKLSPEEMMERKEEEYIPIGRALAQRYLNHGYSQVLKEEADKYSHQEKEIVIRAVVSTLVQAIELGNDELAERAMEGILALKGEGRLGHIKGEIESLFEEYKQVEKTKYEEEGEVIEQRERELLRQLGISGSAIAEINLEACEGWKEFAQELRSQYDRRLEELKLKLLQALGLPRE